MHNVIFIIIGLINCLIIIYIDKTKSYGLIAGYPEASSKKRKEADKNIDIAGHVRYMKNATLIWFLGMSIGIGILGILNKPDIWSATWFITTLLCYVIIIITIGKCYDYTKRGGVPEKIRMYDIKENLWISRFIMAIIFVGGLLPVVFALKEPKVLLSPSIVKIQGMWGFSIFTTEIASVDTVSWKEMPPITLRTNGISLFGVNRGSFKTKEGEKIRLSVKCNVSPVVRIIDRDSKTYYVNRKNPKETRDIFISLTTHLKTEEE